MTDDEALKIILKYAKIHIARSTLSMSDNEYKEAEEPISRMEDITLNGLKQRDVGLIRPRPV